ncbi:MAG: DUF2304 family protein [Anaerolineaceae bacterium]|nr:DUF2304 family protein [Anaerolineaceae bacterium]
MNQLASIAGLAPFQILTIGLGLVIFILTFEMIRRDLLRTAYALLWLVIGLAIVFIGIFPDTVNLLQRYTSMTYQTAMLFLVFGFVLLLMMQFSIIISRLSARNKMLTQDVAILREQLRQVAERVGGRESEDRKAGASSATSGDSPSAEK